MNKTKLSKVLNAFILATSTLSALPALSKTQNTQAASHYKVICENPAECQASVAGLLSDNENVCTSFLVKEDVMATNLHCLPKDLRQKGASCKGRISFTFPESKAFPEEFADCERVLAVSSALKDTPVTPDYAFLKLRHKAERPLVKLSTQGVGNNELLAIYKVDPHEDIGVLRKVTCQAVQGSMLNPLFLTAQSAVISLVPCEIISGNSGSPIFSSSQEVKAIINSKGLPADFPVNVNRFDVAFASNFSCLKVPELGLTNSHQNCKDNSMDRAAVRNASGVLVRDAVHPLLPDFSKYVTEQFRKIHEQTRNFLRWETDQQDIPYTGDDKSAIAKVVFKPKCITASREVLEKMDNLLNIKYSEWGVELHLDSAGRPAPQLTSREVTETVSFSKKDLDKKEIAITMKQNQFTVPFCSEVAQK